MPDLNEIDRNIKHIAQMRHKDMAVFYRFAPVGHVYFSKSLPYHDEFMARFNSLGGMTHHISKKIGHKHAPDGFSFATV